MARPDPTTIHHFHACMACGNIWDHDPPDFDGPETEWIPKTEFNEMHTCQICRTQTHCDIACTDRTEAEELATHGYITIRGRRYYADLV